MNSRPSVVVVGGGVIGCAVARSLALAGASVRLLEARECGLGASWAAAGMLSPYGEVGTPGPFLDLAVASFGDYPEFVERLESETGQPVFFRRSGKLEVALTDGRASHLGQLREWMVSLDEAARQVSTEELRRLEPSIDTGAVVSALHLPNDAHVDNRALARALPLAAARSGVTIHEHTPVSQVLSRTGCCVGVLDEHGVEHHGDLVVLASGAHLQAVAGTPRRLPVAPVLGEMIAYEAPGRLSRMIHTDSVYLIQRGSRLLVGATMQTGRLSASISEHGRTSLEAGAREVLPSLPEPYEQWAGLRPGTPDGIPFMGLDPDMPGLAYAAGHFRNGILLTPATAAWAPMLIEQPPTSGRLQSIDWAAFKVDRELPRSDTNAP